MWIGGSKFLLQTAQVSLESGWEEIVKQLLECSSSKLQAALQHNAQSYSALSAIAQALASALMEEGYCISI